MKQEIARLKRYKYEKKKTNSEFVYELRSEWVIEGIRCDKKGLCYCEITQPGGWGIGKKIKFSSHSDADSCCSSSGRKGMNPTYYSAKNAHRNTATRHSKFGKENMVTQSPCQENCKTHTVSLTKGKCYSWLLFLGPRVRRTTLSPNLKHASICKHVCKLSVYCFSWTWGQSRELHLRF